jgi:enolase-phosphatase E1
MSALIRPFRGVLLDIEGTITPIRFVYETLFPYARQRLPGFVRDHWTDPEVRAAAAALGSASAAHLAAKLLELMDKDSKATALKSLQGRVWRDGYLQGALRGEVFADVPSALERWHAQGKLVAIFSSGSVEAQKLLLRHCSAGDLTRLVAAYFDTTSGPKREADSYRAIALALGLPPADLLFATDVLAEAEAAVAAGFEAVLTDRPGNPPQPEHPLLVLHDFSQL